MAFFHPKARRAVGSSIAVGGVLLMAAACQTDPQDRPHPETSQGDEFGAEEDNEAEQTERAPLEPTKPIDPNNPEDRMTTVTSPPALPPSGGAGAEQ